MRSDENSPASQESAGKARKNLRWKRIYFGLGVFLLFFVIKFIVLFSNQFEEITTAVSTDVTKIRIERSTLVGLLAIDYNNAVKDGNLVLSGEEKALSPGKQQLYLACLADSTVENLADDFVLDFFKKKYSTNDLSKKIDSMNTDEMAKNCLRAVAAIQ